MADYMKMGVPSNIIMLKKETKSQKKIIKVKIKSKDKKQR
jgi:hypothetical protein